MQQSTKYIEVQFQRWRLLAWAVLAGGMAIWFGLCATGIVAITVFGAVSTHFHYDPGPIIWFDLPAYITAFGLWRVSRFLLRKRRTLS
jgi:hypothetical protein